MAGGNLVKAKIVNALTDKAVVCMFNPKEYSLSRDNRWNETDSNGLDVAHLEFSGGSPASLELQLLFDTYEAHPPYSEAGDDVRKHTEELWKMMKIDQSKKNPKTGKGEPPHCRFEWGTLWSFEAVILKITEKYTLFDTDGKPLRAILDVSFKQIKDEDKYPRQNPTSGGHPNEHLRYVHEGETLAAIAYEEYHDATVWRHLAETNNIDNPLRLRPGQVLIVTPLPSI
jgi:hypothetical protein